MSTSTPSTTLWRAPRTAPRGETRGVIASGLTGYVSPARGGRDRMTGFFQIFFYFSYTAVVCFGIFVGLGTTELPQTEIGQSGADTPRQPPRRPRRRQARSATRARACLCAGSTATSRSTEHARSAVHSDASGTRAWGTHRRPTARTELVCTVQHHTSNPSITRLLFAQRGGLRQLAAGELARRMLDPCARAASTCMATMARSGVRQA